MFLKRIKILFFIVIFAVIIIVIFFRSGDEAIEIRNMDKIGASINGANYDDFSAPENASPITGIQCDNYDRRPIAVMMANDPVARPLSGISSADVIVEMQVITGSITRIMALFICEEPGEIGALRSARHDFIPLAMGFDSIFVHWGGSHFALDKLDRGIMDNIDAMHNPFGAFYRKSGISAPHNGFSSYARLLLASKKLGYNQSIDFNDYDFDLRDKCVNCQNGKLIIGYSKPYDVSYVYDAEANKYLRLRNGFSEVDKLNGKQVEAKNIIVVYADSRQIDDQYNDVDIHGSGKAVFYKNGEEVIGLWSKDKDDSASPLEFFDKKNKKMKIVPGKIIIEIVDPGQVVNWSQE